MFQKITIVGNLGRDPEMRYQPDGTAVTNLNVACNRKWTDGSGQPQSETIWFRVSVWGRRAEVCNEYLASGRQVMIEGRLRPDANSGGPRLWTRQDGTMGASFEVTADNVVFLGSGNGHGHGSGHGHGGRQDEGTPGPAQEDDDIPF